jgi:hypothetical protein
LRDEFMITRQGRQYVLFAGLLDAAHAQGLKGIDTELLQLPSDENGRVAVVKAKVQMEDGRTFSGIGDASPENVGRNIAPHVIRMAETRAKARALRDAVNVGATALEELSDGDEAASSYPPQGRSSSSDRSQRGGGQSRSGGGESETVRAVPDEPPAASEAAANGSSEEAPESGARRSGRGGSQARGGSQKARKSQVDLLRTLAEELRGENGVARLEGAIGKPLSELTKAEADEWIDRLTPAEGRE